MPFYDTKCTVTSTTAPKISSLPATPVKNILPGCPHKLHAWGKDQKGFGLIGFIGVRDLLLFIRAVGGLHSAEFRGLSVLVTLRAHLRVRVIIIRAILAHSAQ